LPGFRRAFLKHPRLTPLYETVSTKRSLACFLMGMAGFVGGTLPASAAAAVGL